jgi:predicted dehydrogenase
MSASVSRWAMIGTGWMASNIAGDFQLTESVELTTIVSRTHEKGVKFAAEWDIPDVISDLDELWAAPGVDGVYIATPHPAHFAAARAAIQAGKHVLIEKPMTMTSNQGRELADLAKGAGVFLMEAMWMRFSPVIRKAQEVIASGDIGAVRHVEATFGFSVPFDPESRMWNRELGGGTTLDQGVYTITLAHLILGVPSAVVGRGTIADTGVDSEAAVLLSFPGGEQALLATSMTTLFPQKAAICGTDGQIDIDAPFWAPTSLKVMRSDPTDPPLRTDTFDFPREGNGYVPMLRAVGQAIADGHTEHELHPLATTISVMETMEEVMRQISA